MRHPSSRRLSIAGRPFIVYGLPSKLWQDLYHRFMTASWTAVVASIAGFFVAFNLLFATIYGLEPDSLANLNPPGFWGRFFFSVETLATVGYGDMHPQRMLAHIVATCEIFCGVMSLALLTGSMFARFSRPTARILFARVAAIRPLDGRLTLMLRIANARQNIIMEASAQLRLLRDENTVEGYHIRRIYDLPLRRSAHPALLFGWTLQHVIDASSPLAGASLEALTASRASLLLTVSGTDETTGQVLMSRYSYAPEALRWNHSFVDILTTGADGIDYFDYGKFHEVIPLEQAQGESANLTPPERRSA
jgi:inward rectifier potassium channel